MKQLHHQNNVFIELDVEQARILDSIISMLDRRQSVIESVVKSDEPANNVIHSEKLKRCLYMHDVLEMHNCESQPEMRDLYLKIARPWQRVLDIPTDDYVSALQDVIDIIDNLLTSPLLDPTPLRTERYQKQINLLKWLQSKRQNG